MIWPIYYISTPLLDDLARRETDEMSRVLATRQYADWRTLRFVALNSKQVRKEAERLALRIRDRLDSQGEAAVSSTPPVAIFVRGKPVPPEAIDELMQALEAAEAVIASTQRAVESQGREPRTFIVDAGGQGDFSALNDALAVTQKDDTLVVKRGTYKETIAIQKPLTIIGEGQLGDVRIEAVGAPAIHFRAEYGKVSNLWVEQQDTRRKPTHAAVVVQSGKLEIESCSLTSLRSFAIIASHGTELILRGSQIYHCGASGVYIFGSDAKATIEDNDVVENGHAGVTLRDHASAVVRDNRIQRNSFGIYVYMNAAGNILNNHILDNTHSGLQVFDDASAIVSNNVIEGSQTAIEIYDDATGTFTENDLRKNERAWNIHDTDEGKVIRSRNMEETSAVDSE